MKGAKIVENSMKYNLWMSKLTNGCGSNFSITLEVPNWNIPHVNLMMNQNFLKKWNTLSHMLATNRKTTKKICSTNNIWKFTEKSCYEKFSIEGSIQQICRSWENIPFFHLRSKEKLTKDGKKRMEKIQWST